MPRIPALAVAALVTLALSACASGVPSPTQSPETAQRATETVIPATTTITPPETTTSHPETQSVAEYSTTPECASWVASRNAEVATADQLVVQIAPGDLPFSEVNQDPILCTAAIYSIDPHEPKPFEFEVIVNNLNGVGMSLFMRSPELQEIKCPDFRAIYCYLDDTGNFVVVEDSPIAARETFGTRNLIIVHVETTPEWRNT